MTLSARARCPLLAAQASFAFTSRVIGQGTSPFAVGLQGGLSPDPEGSCHSVLVRPTGTVSLSLGIGGFMKVTFRFDETGMGDLEREGREEELG